MVAGVSSRVASAGSYATTTLAPRLDEPHADLAVLGQAVRVPAAGLTQQVAPEEHGVAAERNEPLAGVEVQPAAEPEEVLEDVAQACTSSSGSS